MTGFLCFGVDQRRGIHVFLRVDLHDQSGDSA